MGNIMKNIILIAINNFFPSFLFKLHNNKVVFSSFRGDSYSGNGKYLTEALLKLDKNLDIVWLDLDLENSKIYPDSVRVVKYNSLRSIYELATAKIWVDDFRKKYSPPKKKTQKYFQLWHGAITLKKVERDIIDELDSHYLKEAKRDGRISDYMVSGNSVSTELFENSFWFNGKVLEFGNPRMDLLINADSALIEKKVNDYFKLNEDAKILLYAPTFRDDRQKALKIYKLHFDKILASLHSKFGGTWRIIIKLHPNIKSIEKDIVSNPDVILGSNYPDIQSLLLRSDIIVTDFSSLMFDAMLINKKVFLYAPDVALYEKNRGVYFKLSNLPFDLAKTEKKLIANIINFNSSAYYEKINNFSDEISVFEDGKASYRLATFIDNIVKDVKQ